MKSHVIYGLQQLIQRETSYIECDLDDVGNFQREKVYGHLKKNNWGKFIKHDKNNRLRPYFF